MNDKPLTEFKPIYIQDVQPCRDDEISLVDLALIVSRRKTLLMLITLIFIVAGIAIALIQPKQYTYSTSLEIGSQFINGNIQPLEGVDTLLAKLQHSYIPFILKSSKNANNKEEKEYKIQASIPKNSQIIVIESKAAETDADKITDLLGKITVRAIEDHNTIYTKLQRNLQSLKHQTEQKLQALATKPDASSEINALQLSLDSYNLQLTNLRKTREILPPMASAEPTGTSRKLIVVMATLVGVFLGLFAVFLAEFMAKVRQKQNEHAA